MTYTVNFYLIKNDGLSFESTSWLVSNVSSFPASANEFNNYHTMLLMQLK